MKKHILQNELELENILKTHKRVIMQFSAHWCGPCARITPLLTEYLGKVNRDDVIYVYCDVDVVGDLSDKFKVNSIPSFHCYIQEKNEWADALVSGSLSSILEYCTKNDALDNKKEKTIKAN